MVVDFGRTVGLFGGANLSLFALCFCLFWGWFVCSRLLEGFLNGRLFGLRVKVHLFLCLGLGGTFTTHIKVGRLKFIFIL